MAIDPTSNDLPAEHRKLLDDFLLAEEKKYKDKRVDKQKFLKRGEGYSQKEDGPFFHLPHHDISRSPNRYEALVVLPPDQPMPDQNERKRERDRRGANVLYLRYNRESQKLEVCASEDEEPQSLTEAKRQRLAEMFSNQKKNPIHLNEFIVKVQVYCGYPQYRYTVTEVGDKPEANGNVSEVNPAVGELLFCGEGKDHQTQFKAFSKDMITKTTLINDFVAGEPFARKEQELLKIPALQKRLESGEVAVQKVPFHERSRTASTSVKSMHFTQRRVPGYTLLELLQGYRTKKDGIREDIALLTDKVRENLITGLLEAMCRDRAAGIVHRDIKPENIMVDIASDGTIREINIIDYGSARRRGVDDGEQIGTAVYMPPEAVLYKNALSDEKGDDYAMGVVLRKLVDDKIIASDSRGSDAKTMRQHDYCEKQIQRYQSNISLPKPESALLKNLKNNPDTSKKGWLIEEILYGMTLTSRDERVCAEKALSWLKKPPGIVDCFRDARDDTWLRNVDAAEREKIGFSEYFFGWPGRKGGLAWVSYCLGGFLISPVKSVLKVPEFLVKTAAYALKFSIRLLERRPLLNAREKTLWYGLNFLCYSARGLGWMISAVSSPMANARAGFKSEYPIRGAASFVVSTAAVAAIALFALPFVLALVAVKTGITAMTGGSALFALRGCIVWPLEKMATNTAQLHHLQPGLYENERWRSTGARVIARIKRGPIEKAAAIKVERVEGLWGITEREWEQIAAAHGQNETPVAGPNDLAALSSQSPLRPGSP